MKICVCIPSYRRPIVETLNYLPFAKVFIDKTDEDEYKKQNTRADIHVCPDGVQGNTARIRNYILNTMFGEGYEAVCLVDDDMKGIYRFNVNGFYGYEKSLVEKDSFLTFIEANSEMCNEWGYKLWGINPTPDATAYRHYTPFSTTSFIGGPFNVHLNSKIRYDESLPLKEDYDLTIQHCSEYRGVLRLNAYHYMCKQAENRGGCAIFRTNKKEKEQFELLQKKWGSKIIKKDKVSKRAFDFNPIMHIPIKGV